MAAFCPDNLQLVAMRIEVENLRGKGKPANSSEESESEEEAEE
jgi:hypothetical protein